VPFTTTADAVARETAWLTAVDALPPLLIASGGRWEFVQGYRPRTPLMTSNEIWVTRRAIRIERFGMIRKIAKYQFVLRAYWGKTSGTGQAEADQAAFDVAINDVLTRINGIGPPVADKTHGNRFMSVAEDPTQIDVVFTPPDAAGGPRLVLQADISYWADDFDFNM
jgi:hypothetical protein